jgi:hypothetical protein
MTHRDNLVELERRLLLDGYKANRFGQQNYLHVSHGHAQSDAYKERHPGQKIPQRYAIVRYLPISDAYELTGVENWPQQESTKEIYRIELPTRGESGHLTYDEDHLERLKDSIVGHVMIISDNEMQQRLTDCIHLLHLRLRALETYLIY